MIVTVGSPCLTTSPQVVVLYVICYFFFLEKEIKKTLFCRFIILSKIHQQIEVLVQYFLY